nr:ribonuclease H-like domain-containing protein [Tanacetum cinerariifolium]
GTKFKNSELIEFCRLKGSKREYSNARTPQQNEVAEKKNETLIEAAKTMLADSFLPTTFWVEAVNTALENQANKSAGPKEASISVGTQDNNDQSANSEEIDLHEEHFVLPIWSAYSTTVKSSGNKTEKNTDYKTREKPVSQVKQIFLEELKKLKKQEKEANDAAELLRKEATHDIQNDNTSSTNLLNTVNIPLNCWSFMSIL